ncbi:MAG: MgtC/SapB family protein [Sedimentisphaerales bacterium]|nr:MgtC/SapB family protein [Sedimentisphaerales bacterium]
MSTFETMGNLAFIQEIGWEQVFSMVIAVFLGGAIGFEREWNGKPAGLRTNIIICLGACAFTIIAENISDGNPDAATRIAAGIVTGVGFLGAGALIHGGDSIHGLTTAASIWLVTSIGIACGTGEYLTAVSVTSLALFALFGLMPLTRWIRRKSRRWKDIPPYRGNGTNGSGLAGLMQNQTREGNHNGAASTASTEPCHTRN